MINGLPMQLFLFKNISLLFNIFFITLCSGSLMAQELPQTPSGNIINVPINIVDVSPTSILLTEERINNVVRKINQDSTAWNALTTKISNYFQKVPYNAGEYAGAFALAYYVSGEKKYIDRAKVLLKKTYFSEPTTGWEYYNSRNMFRINARWAIMGYSWIKNSLSVSEQIEIESIFKVWSEFWLKHVDYSNDFQNLRVADTDDVTSITKNLTLLGYVLSNSTEHSSYGLSVLDAADSLLNNIVVNYYMKDIMKGGAWAEGSDYSPSTQGHWIETFLINKEQRGIDFPINYAKEAMQSMLHQTLANGTGVYKYGSEERATDYDTLGGDYRYELAMSLMAILKDHNDLSLINDWFNKLINKQGFKSGSMATHFDRLLFHDPHFSDSQETTNLDTYHYAEGIGLISSRSSWDNDATNLFFINRKIRVDHEHKDALSFDIAHQGEWITKEATGYGGVSESSIAHNTILIENADNGSSSPTRRPEGEPFYNTLFDDENVTLISADATNIYNMSGYFSTKYVSLVNRQLAFLKPNTVIVYDHVITDNTQNKDLIHYNKLQPNLLLNRWVKIIQHVQAKPTQINGFKNSYQIHNTNNSLVYQVISPQDPIINIVDEKQLWDGSLQYEVPDNQRKWHFEISFSDQKEESELITTLNFAANNKYTTDELILTPIHMTIENGYILSGNIKGLAIKRHTDNYIILFNKEPKAAITNAKIKRPKGFEDALVYGIGFDITN